MHDVQFALTQCQADLTFSWEGLKQNKQTNKQNKTKNVCLPFYFTTEPKYWKIRVGFYFYYYYYYYYFILNCVLLDLNVQNKMSKYIATVPKKLFWPDIMEYNPFQQQGQTNSEALHMPKNLLWFSLAQSVRSRTMNLSIGCIDRPRSSPTRSWVCKNYILHEGANCSS